MASAIMSEPGPSEYQHDSFFYLQLMAQWWLVIQAMGRLACIGAGVNYTTFFNRKLTMPSRAFGSTDISAELTGVWRGRSVWII